MGEGSLDYQRKGSEFEDESEGTERTTITTKNTSNEEEWLEDAISNTNKTSSGWSAVNLISLAIGGVVTAVLAGALLPSAMNYNSSNYQTSTTASAVIQSISSLTTWIPILAMPLILFAIITPLLKSDFP